MINIYDFDDTIFDGDSSVCFIKYSLIHKPFLVLLSGLRALKEVVKYIFHKSNIGLIKSELFSFVKYIKNFDEYMDNYVLKYQDRIKPYYLLKHQSSDVVISASFEFIVKPLCEKVNITRVIGTRYDVKKGRIIGNNCKGEEKIKRFKEIYKDVVVNEAYSDSLSDVPMFEIAKKGYLVRGYDLVLYENNNK